MRKVVTMVVTLAATSVVACNYGETSSDRSVPTTVMKCSNGALPLKMVGYQLQTDNRLATNKSGALPISVEISRANCTRPTGDWSNNPAAVSSRLRDCGDVFDKNNNPIFEGTTRIRRCRIRPVVTGGGSGGSTGGGSEVPKGQINIGTLQTNVCNQVVGTVSLGGSVQASFNTRYRRQGSCSGYTDPRRVLATASPTSPYNFGCDRRMTETCTEFLEVSCAKNGSTTFCPAD